MGGGGHRKGGLLVTKGGRGYDLRGKSIYPAVGKSFLKKKSSVSICIGVVRERTSPVKRKKGEEKIGTILARGGKNVAQEKGKKNYLKKGREAGT